MIGRPCYVCPGTMRPGETRLLEEAGDDVVVIEHVPAIVCDTRGERAFSGSVLDTINSILDERPTPSGRVEAAFYDFARQHKAVKAG